MLKLVKDYINDRTIFYWVTDLESMEAMSPEFRTFDQAEEWWKEFMFTQFSGKERRETTYDRRRDQALREKYAEQHKNQVSSGRRITDMAIKIDLDLHKEKTA